MKPTQESDTQRAAVDHERLVRLCDLHEDLGKLQPNLEFKNEFGKWVPSGLTAGRVSKSTVGMYREVIEMNKSNKTKTH